jgi:hypothetical protein
MKIFIFRLSYPRLDGKLGASRKTWSIKDWERHFLSAFSKKPGRQPGLRRTLKFGAGQFRRTG